MLCSGLVVVGDYKVLWGHCKVLCRRSGCAPPHLKHIVDSDMVAAGGLRNSGTRDPRKPEPLV